MLYVSWSELKSELKTENIFALTFLLSPLIVLPLWDQVDEFLSFFQEVWVFLMSKRY